MRLKPLTFRHIRLHHDERSHNLENVLFLKWTAAGAAAAAEAEAAAVATPAIL